ncbi:3-methyl-2-oxobutanoate hydroxymethyltransferase (plasmid) [Candidatus Riesia sp. GBBU]|nr:3-methyl-2-oxobutanoate hydroxymethyltransferase [Candidatus Riesia sp. GBBU]
MKKINIGTLIDLKKSGKKFASLTVYDANFSRIFERNGIKVLLVGDSLGMTVLGFSSTIPVSIESIEYHTRIVRKGAPNSFIISDVPFSSFSSKRKVIEDSIRLMVSGSNMVKLEWKGNWIKSVVHSLNKRSIPVCIHFGLTPQSENVFGNYRVFCREYSESRKLLDESKNFEKFGKMNLLLLECVPKDLAEEVTNSVSIPVIGIGAGNKTDGQMLVMHDMLGLYHSKKTPKFVKNFLLQEKGDVAKAIKSYIMEVEKSIYPSEEHSY